MSSSNLNAGAPTSTVPTAGPTSSGGPRVGRRALITAAAVGAAAVATPFVVEKGVELSATEVKTLLSKEITSLEKGVETFTLDEAIQAAEFTRKVMQLIVLPVANFYATISGGSLGVLIGALQQAEAVLGIVHVPTSLFSGLIGVLQGWQTNVELFPATLNANTNGELTNAENYLKALKAKVS